MIGFLKMSKGVYAGLNVEGAVVGVRKNLNEADYEMDVSPVQTIVEKKVSNNGSEQLRANLKEAAK